MLAVLRHPIGGLTKWGGLQLAGPPLCLPHLAYQSGTLQHLEVLGNGRRTHRKRFGQLSHRCFAKCQSCQDCSARGVCQGRKSGTEGIGGTHGQIVINLLVKYNSSTSFEAQPRPIEDELAHVRFVADGDCEGRTQLLAIHLS
jgi:hypothetical protein